MKVKCENKYLNNFAIYINEIKVSSILLNDPNVKEQPLNYLLELLSIQDIKKKK